LPSERPGRGNNMTAQGNVLGTGLFNVNPP